MDHSQAPILEALEHVLEAPIAGFGGPGHHMGGGASDDVRRLLGLQAFRADVLTPKGLDDRTESAAVMRRAWALAADAWGASACRFSTGGSTQGVQTALATFAAPGDTVLVASNAHKAERLSSVSAGLDVRTLAVEGDRERRLEHGVDPAVLDRALRDAPDCKAVLVVSPTFYGVTSDIAALAEVAHAHDTPLIVDAAWGGAFAFCAGLPANPLAQGADMAVSSVHKTMGALAQGAVVLAGPRVDQGRFALAFDLLQTTSPSVPVLASIDALRRRHVLEGEALWACVILRARAVRREVAAIPGLTVLGREALTGRPGALDLDETKVLIDVSGLGATGFQVDGWLAAEHRVSVVLSDARYILAVFSVGTSDEDAGRLVRGLAELPDAVRRHPARFHPADADAPCVLDLTVETALPGARAFYGPTETVRFEEAAGRVAAEVVAPTPPEIPRLVPGQRISEAHVRYLLAQRAAGAFIPDVAGHGEGLVRVVRAPS